MKSLKAQCVCVFVSCHMYADFCYFKCENVKDRFGYGI